jgi:heme exporter protein D
MEAWFFWLATVITVAFLVMMVILFICQWVIYFRVEKTVMQRQHPAYLRQSQAEEGD